MGTIDPLDLYRRLLGLRAEALAAEDFAQGAAEPEANWHRADRARYDDSFVELDRIFEGVMELEVDYAAERVAIATAVERLGLGAVEDGPASTFDAAGKMLGFYAKRLGDNRSARIEDEASQWADHIDRHDARWVRERARELAAPFPAPEILERQIESWVKRNPAAAVALLAAERAEPTAPEIEAPPRLELPVEVPRAVSEAPELNREPDPRPDLDREPPPSVSGPEVEKLIAQRAAAIGAELEQVPLYKLGQRAVELSVTFLSRRPELDVAIREADATGDEVASGRLREEWIDLHAEWEAVGPAVETAIDRDRAAKSGPERAVGTAPVEMEPEGGFELD